MLSHGSVIGPTFKRKYSSGDTVKSSVCSLKEKSIQHDSDSGDEKEDEKEIEVFEEDEVVY